MYLKVMSDVNLDDRAPDKPFQLFDCKTVSFRRPRVYREDSDAPSEKHFPTDYHHAVIDGEGIVLLNGSAYILNNSGKTIESYWPRDMDVSITLDPGEAISDE